MYGIHKEKISKIHNKEKWIKGIKILQLNTPIRVRKLNMLSCVFVCRHGPVSCISSFLMYSSLSVTCATSLRSLRRMKSYFLKELLSWFVPNWNTVMLQNVGMTSCYAFIAILCLQFYMVKH